MSMSDTKLKCPRCKGDLKKIQSKKNQKFYWICQSAEEVCSAIYSDRNGEPLLLTFGEPDPTCPCPDCGQPMRLVQGGQFGDYWSCTAYPACKGTLDVMPDGSMPPPCPEDDEHGPMKIRPGKNGKFLGCRKYPECSATLEMDGSAGKKPGGKK
ncbi:MAG: topoisomerase DNA-binding C4 zinc finger domain-containing protein [Acidiferrobacteraceae bacterium]